MCGIIATVNHLLSEADVDRLRHRGPDGAGLNVFGVGAHHVSLGHRRLSIVDLSEAGAQPMQTASRDGCLIFNGEIYNHAALRKLIPEYAFRGHSDTETLLYLFHKFGPSCLNWLNGIFGFAYLDLNQRKLFLARDRFGVKPLYWAADGTHLAAASEIRGINDFTTPRISTESLALLLRHRHVPSPLTLWQNIRKVPPAHYVEVDLSCTELRFDVRPLLGRVEVSHDPVSVPGERGIGDCYAAKVDAAIRRQLMADVEVGVFLSGGLDSAVTAACMRKHLGTGVRAYTVGYEEQDSADEIDPAGRIAQALGFHHETIRISERAFADTFARVAEIVEEPVAASSMIPLYALARLAAQDVKVVLSGQGADELLGGYTRYQAARGIQFLRRAGLAKPVAALITKARPDRTAQQVADGLSAKDDLAAYCGLTELFTADEVGRLLGGAKPPDAHSISALAAHEDSAKHPDFTNFVMERDARTSLPDELLMYTDKVTMEFSLECRVPFLDLELAAFLQGLPGRAKVGFTRRKRLQHDLLQRWLPGISLPQKKNGFFVPSTSWFGEGASIRRELFSKESAMAGFFDMDEVDKVVQERDKHVKSDKHVFMLAAIGLWLDRHYRTSSATVEV